MQIGKGEVQSGRDGEGRKDTEEEARKRGVYLTNIDRVIRDGSRGCAISWMVVEGRGKLMSILLYAYRSAPLRSSPRHRTFPRGTASRDNASRPLHPPRNTDAAHPRDAFNYYSKYQCPANTTSLAASLAAAKTAPDELGWEGATI